MPARLRERRLVFFARFYAQRNRHVVCGQTIAGTISS